MGGNAEKDEEEKALLDALKALVAEHRKLIAYARFSGSHSGEHDLRSK
jgi:hypothetical protein